MYKIKEAIIVEGAYDKIKLSGFIDGLILTTHGFAVYSNADFIRTFARLANETGIVILTDSDSAGLRIRNFIKQKAEGGRVLHAYVPDIAGKERRKRKSSAEGLLGVEGMTEDIIIKALRDAGCEIDDSSAAPRGGGITKADLYCLGLSGSDGSRELREKLAARFGLPTRLSANMLLDVLNRITDINELAKMSEKLRKIDSDE
ncbi:MAG: toprim domain-containing protein [Candidatus Ornithomonoglobus sp.]